MQRLTLRFGCVAASFGAVRCKSKCEAEGDIQEIDMEACRRAVRARWAVAEKSVPARYDEPAGARWHWLDRELSSNVAGEAGAVAIYEGARCALRLRGGGGGDDAAAAFAAEHEAAERQHLTYFELLVPPHQRTRLLPIWRAAGFALGFAPTFLLGPAGLYATVRSVETFVEEHYSLQIDTLMKEEGTRREPLSAADAELVRLLRLCCADEVHHKIEAARLLEDHNVKTDALAVRAWDRVVTAGSAVAAEAARRF